MSKKAKSTLKSRKSLQNGLPMDVWEIPLPGEIPTSFSSTPLKPPPFPAALTSCLSKFKTYIKSPEKNSSKTLSFKVNEQCYQPPSGDKKSILKTNNKCYELPVEIDAAPSYCDNKKILISDKADSFYVTEMARLQTVKKRLSVLKSTENMDGKLAEKELKKDDSLANISKPHINNNSTKLETNTRTPLKRSHSKMNDELTPKRKYDTPSARSSTSKSSFNNSQQSKSLPTTRTTTNSDGPIQLDKSVDIMTNPTKRRNTFPSSKLSSTSEAVSSPSSDSHSSSLKSPSSSLKSPRSSLKSPHSAVKSPYSEVKSPHSALKSPSLSFNSPVLSPLSHSYKRCRTDQTPYETGSSFHQRKRVRTILPYYNPFELMNLESEWGFIDSHCHLDFLFDRLPFHGSYSEYQEKNKETFPKCYKGCLAIFCNPFIFFKKYKWNKFLKEDNVWAAFGCHPHNAKDYNDDIEKDLRSALEHPKVRALGEIGLDYSNRNKCMKEVQFEAFRRQLKIAVEKSLPVVIHCREAHDDGMKILKEILPRHYTIHLHCFTDTWELAQKWLDEFPNLFIGITNVVTFPSAECVHEVARNIPLSRLLLETDAPYFNPKMGPKGTKCSHPGMAIHVAAQIAALKDIPLEQVLQATRKNTKQMYNI